MVVTMISSLLAPALTRRVSTTGILLTFKRPTTCVRYLTSSSSKDNIKNNNINDAGVETIQEIKMSDDLGINKIVQWHFEVGDTINYDNVFVDRY
jgi:hypothetical protein